MKKYSFVAALLIALTFTGCINIVEEIFLNKDGSGQYTITMDASGLMEGGGLRSMMQMMGEEEGGNPLEGLDGPLEMDSVIYMKDAPADIRKQMIHPELLDRITMRQIVSEEKEIMKTVFILDFKEVKEIDYFLSDFGNLSGQGQEMAAIGGMMNGMIGGKTINGLPLYTRAKKMLTRSKTEKISAGEEEDQNMQMMKMMLADASYKLIYHLPGKVKSTNLQNARVEGKDIIQEVSLLDYMDGKKDLSGFIKHKSR